MKLFFSIALLVLSCIFISCQREIDGNFTSENENQSDSIYISQCLLLDTTFSPRQDTLDLITFKYDVQKRLTEIIDFTPKGPLTSTEDNTVTEKYFYSGADTLPARYEYKNVSGSTVVFARSIFLKYNADKKINEDSTIVFFSIGGTSTHIRKFSQLNDSTYKITLTLQQGWPAYDSTLVTKTIVGNTITRKEVAYLGGSVISTRTIKRIFDTKSNPFHRVALKYLTGPELGYYLSQNYSAEKHNQESEDDGISAFSTLYQYRADGYPLLSFDITPPPNGYKRIYTYIKL